MKKFFASAVLLCLALVVALPVTALAWDGDDEVAYITIRVDAESGAAYLNGAPTGFVVTTQNGMHMVPVVLIAEAFGADFVLWADHVVLTYMGVEMWYIEGRDYAVINDQNITMPVATGNIDGVFVAPLRFIAESFGADVFLDEETGDLWVERQAEGMGQEVDFRRLLRYGHISHVGNSRERWRFAVPQNFDMDQWGGSYSFAIEDISLSLEVLPNRNNLTLDQLYLEMERRAQGSGWWAPRGVVFERYQGTHAGAPYARVRVRREWATREYHGFLANNRIYILVASIPFGVFSPHYENITLRNILASLELDFDGTDEESTHDIAIRGVGRTAHLLREDFEDPHLGWTISVQENWRISEVFGFYNRVVFFRDSDHNTMLFDDFFMDPFFDMFLDIMGEEMAVTPAMLEVAVFSNPENETVDEWIGQTMAYFRSGFNPALVTVSAPVAVQVGAWPAQKVVMDMDQITHVRRTEIYFLPHGDYRYLMVLDYDLRDAATDGFLIIAHEMVQSFVPGDIDLETTGHLLPPYNHFFTDPITTEFVGAFVSFTVPYLWNVREWGTSVQIGEGAQSWSMHTLVSRSYLDVIDDDGNHSFLTVEEHARAMLIQLRRWMPRTLVVERDITVMQFNGRPAYSFVVSTTESGIRSWSEMIFVTGADNTVFIISVDQNDLTVGTRNDRIIAEILETLVFLD